MTSYIARLVRCLADYGRERCKEGERERRREGEREREREGESERERLTHPVTWVSRWFKWKWLRASLVKCLV